MKRKQSIKGFHITGFLLFAAPSAYADITGMVFRDFNGNGARESAEPLVAGILVKATDASGSQCGTTQTTTNSGTSNYAIAGCSGAVRVEFETPATGCQIDKATDFSALGGDAYGTSVQFLADSASSAANFAVHYPGEYGGDSGYIPKLFNIAMRAGDPLVASPTAGDADYTANQSTVFATGYFEDGPYFKTQTEIKGSTEAQRQVGHTVLGNAGQTGTLWGNAYSPQAERLFVSAFLKRHAGMGPLGAGGIYMLDPANPDLSANIGFVSLDALGFPTHAASGALNIKSNANRLLPAKPYNIPTHDVDAYDQVGKTSLGDLDISADGRYLYSVNLYDRKLYRLDLQNPASPVIPTAAQVSSYAIPNDCSGNAGEYRPFGLKFHRNKLYVGTVCSGEDATLQAVGTSADMKLNVYEYDANSLATAPVSVYSQSLAYRDTDTIQFGGNNAKWEAWTTAFHTQRNEPMLTDIEFDSQGNLLLGLTERNSYQVGSGNYSTNTSDTTGYQKVYAGGDILKLGKGADCSYSPVVGSYDNKDFYLDNSRWWAAQGCGETCHAEIPLGAIATHRFADRNEVVGTTLNPVSYTSNGYIAWNNDDGKQVRANEI